MTSSQRFKKIILAALSLSIAVPIVLQFVRHNWRAIAADVQTQNVEGRSSASSEEGAVTRLLDLSGRELAEFEGRLYRFSPNGERFVTESLAGAGRFNLFNRAGNRLLQFEADSVQFSPNGQRIVVTSNYAAYLYDAAGQKLAQKPQGSLSFPVFSPDSRRLIIFADDSVYLLDASGHQIARIEGTFIEQGNGFDTTTQRFILNRLGAALTCDLFAPSGQMIVQISGACTGMSPNGQRFSVTDGTSDEPFLRLYNVSGQRIARLSAALPTFSSDGKFILTNDFFSRNLSHLYRSSGEEIAQLQGAGGRFSPNAQRLVTVLGNVVYLYDSSGQEIARLPGNRAAFLPEGDRLVTYLFGVNESQPLDISGGETRLFDNDGRELALLKGNPPLSSILFEAGELSQVSEFVGWFATFLSPDGQHLVTTDAQNNHDTSKNSYLYNASGEQIAELPGIFISFSSTGQHLLTQKENTFYLFDRSGKKLLEIAGQDAVFSPDGQTFAVTEYRSP